MSNTATHVHNNDTCGEGGTGRWERRGPGWGGWGSQEGGKVSSLSAGEGSSDLTEEVIGVCQGTGAVICCDS